METLSQKNKINILKTFLQIIEKDHPDFQEEHTTGWDLIENAKLFIKELESNSLTESDDSMEVFNLKIGDKQRCRDEHGPCLCNEQQILNCTNN